VGFPSARIVRFLILWGKGEGVSIGHWVGRYLQKRRFEEKEETAQNEMEVEIAR